MSLRAVTAPMVVPPFGSRFIFSFGDYLNEEDLGEFGILPRPICTAVIQGRRWIINAEGHATMVGQRGFDVHGQIYEVPEPELIAFELQLGVPRRWERFGGLVLGDHGRLVASEYFLSTCRKAGLGQVEYVERIARRGEQLGFPADYIAQIRAWAEDPIPEVIIFGPGTCVA